ncbi:MAG: antibiotic biosynthesis monooxygenase [Sphingobacteriales bacterium]|jgi:heme-degrading monooxygenase HmoA|nr:MAG: antibiotic biosynthesis monooxygenase [Sphingobacteriales bacterium]
MILEAILLTIKPNENNAYEENFKQASELIKRAKGYITHELHKCVENENQYILLIKWETYDNHMVDFRNSEDFVEWRRLLHDFYDPKPQVFHYHQVY